MIDKIKTVLFTVVVTAVFALLVSGVNAALQETINNNKVAARQKVILSLFGYASETAKLSTDDLQVFYKKNVDNHEAFTGKSLQGFKLKSSDKDIVVCSFSGQGFWDVIKGFIAIAPRAQVIKGIEFTQHGETPGLGGRISEPQFKARFADKPIPAPDSEGVRLDFVPEGSADKPREIDGITGATGTTSALETIINKSVNQILTTLERGAEN
ncbi:MAG: FMN-binding protein [Candidatus Rifleibacteriota bacterium]